MTPFGLARKVSAGLKTLQLKTEVGTYSNGEAYVRVFRALKRRRGEVLAYDSMGLITINPSTLRVTVEHDSDPELFALFKGM